MIAVGAVAARQNRTQVRIGRIPLYIRLGPVSADGTRRSGVNFDNPARQTLREY